MAGIIGARTNNNTGIAGIAGGNGTVVGPILYILDVEVNGQTQTDAAINALVEATVDIASTNVGFGCHAINMSLHQSIELLPMRDALADAYRHGAIVSACMGNYTGDSQNALIPQYPAAYEDEYVISVGGKSEGYERYSYGCYGSHMDVMGPAYGNHIYTTVGNSVGFSGGETSSATAHVSGLVALLVDAYDNSGTNIQKDYYPEDIENLIEAGCVDENNSTGTIFDDEVGWGFVSATNTINYLDSPYILKHYTHSQQISQAPSVNRTLPGLVTFKDLNNSSNIRVLTNVAEYKFTSSAMYPDSYTSVVKTWGIGNQNTGSEGYHPARVTTKSGSTVVQPTYQMGYTNVESYTSSQCELATYYYYGDNVYSGSKEWVPFDPIQAGSIDYNYSVLGTTATTNTDAVSDSRAATLDLNIYPNPVQPSTTREVVVTIAHSAGTKYGTIRLHDYLGRIVKEQSVYSTKGKSITVRLDIVSMNPGIYMLSYKYDNGVVSKKICLLK